MEREQDCLVTVDYNKTLEEMVAEGRYDFVNRDITVKNFPITGSGKIEVDFQLIQMKESICSGEVLFYMEENNLRPATLPELLAFGSKYPETQLKFPVFALGSSLDHPLKCIDGNSLSIDDTFFPCLLRGGFERYLHLISLENERDDYCRFLAVRIK